MTMRRTLPNGSIIRCIASIVTSRSGLNIVQRMIRFGGPRQKVQISERVWTCMSACAWMCMGVCSKFKLNITTPTLPHEKEKLTNRLSDKSVVNFLALTELKLNVSSANDKRRGSNSVNDFYRLINWRHLDQRLVKLVEHHSCIKKVMKWEGETIQFTTVPYFFSSCVMLSSISSNVTFLRCSTGDAIAVAKNVL